MNELDGYFGFRGDHFTVGVGMNIKALEELKKGLETAMKNLETEEALLANARDDVRRGEKAVVSAKKLVVEYAQKIGAYVGDLDVST